jgi:hypothetical protein
MGAIEMSVLDSNGPERVIWCEDGIAVAQVGGICVVIWRDAVVPHRFSKQASGLAEVVGSHPCQAGFLCVIEPTAKPPDDKLRRASQEMIQSHEERLCCTACVIEGTGFKAAVTRSVLASITLLIANRKAPISYFASVSEAGHWMNKIVPIASISQLATSVENLRAMLPPFETKRSYMARS